MMGRDLAPGEVSQYGGRLSVCPPEVKVDAVCHVQLPLNIKVVDRWRHQTCGRA